MKIKKLIFSCILIILLFGTEIVYSQIGFSNKIDSLINLITTQTISKLNRELSGDTIALIGGSPYTIETRHWNSPSNPKAAQFIYEKFLSFGLNTRYQNNSTTDINVIAVKTGTKYPNQYFVICSHYDDMPAYPTNPLAPGADDNASGTVGVIEAARILSNINLDYTIVFAAFDEEERGLYGSKGYSDTAYLHGDSIVGVINLDMIAYDGNNDSKSYIVTNTNSSSFADEVISALNTYIPTLNPTKYFDNTANSDHASFWTHNWKAICSIEDENDFTPYYHTVNDKFNTLNIPFFLKMAKGAISALAAFAADYKMTFIHTPITSGPGTGIRTATAVITSKKRVARLNTTAPRLYYKINNGAFSYVNAYYNNLDTFKFNIPGQSIGTTVAYYIAAQDSLGQFVCTYPAGGKGISPPGTTPPANLFTYQIESLTTACVGTGTSNASYPYNTYWHDSKTDMLYTASEITANGGGVGNIMKIGFNISAIASQVMNGFTIKMQNSNLTTLTGFVLSNWSTAYSGTYTVTSTGIQYIDLQTPFYWNGVSNLLIEICFDNTSYTTSSTVLASSAPGMTWLQQLDNNAGCSFTDGLTQSYRPNLCLKIDAQQSSISNNSNTPSKYSLSQNYPNPFNPITNIDYSIPKSGFVSLKIFDILGREISTLVSEFKNAGYYNIDFNASDLSSGVYYYKFESGDYSEVKRMTIIK
jgi:hypothetical protein